jgi:predicted MPP superfamily phosphohydrolase
MSTRNPLSLVIPILLALTAYVLLHYLAYTRAANGLGLSAPARVWLKAGLALAALSFILGEVFSGTAWASPLLLVGSTWFGVLAMAVALVPVEWLLSLVFPGQRKAITIFTLVILLCLAVFTLINGSRQPVVKDIRVSVEKMPAGLSGFTVVQLSDLHLGRHSSLDRLRSIVDRVNDMSPDLVVITGDLIDGDVCQGAGLCQCLREIKARHGVVAVPGNHDYYAGYETFLRVARESNISVLRNERRLIAGAIQLAGVDEPAGRSFAEGGPDLDKALAGRDPGRPTILLSHRPDGFDRAAGQHVDLQLSGHTHAGQIPPMDLIVWLIYPYSYGYHERSDSRIYVSCGTGTWGPPMRLFSRNEIVRFTLV